MNETLIFLGKFIGSVLLVYRLAHAVSLETGPWEVFFRIREWSGKKWGFGKWQNEFFNCPLCQSMWYSLVVDLIVFRGMGFVDFVLTWFSASCVVLIIHLTLYRR